MSIGALVVVGASLAGLRAVEAARKAGFAGPVTLVGAEAHPPYDRPPLSKAFLLDATPPDVAFRTHVQLAELDVTGRFGEPAVALDDRAVVLAGGDRIGFDACVIATGAAARPLPGADGLAGVHLLRDLDDAVALRAALAARPRHLLVVGAGFIGSEVASAARARGVEVTVVEAATRPLTRSLGPELGVALAGLHSRHGTALRTGYGVDRLVGSAGRVSGAVLTDGTAIDTDLVVVGIGATPNTGWLTGSGVSVGDGATDGVLCDATLATTVPGVWAAGDVARWPNPAFGRTMRLEHWTSAAEQGAVAARNALDPAAARSYTTVPYFWSDWYGSRIQFVGVPGDGHEVVAGDLDGGPFVALLRDGDRLAGALLVDHPASTMKYRALITRGAGWDEALRFARRRHPGAAPGGVTRTTVPVQ